MAYSDHPLEKRQSSFIKQNQRLVILRSRKLEIFERKEDPDSVGGMWRNLSRRSDPGAIQGSRKVSADTRQEGASADRGEM